MREMIRAVVAILLAFVLFAGRADAHKLEVFASVEGDAITGYAYFSPGGRAQQASVTATAPDGTVLFTGQTGGDGTFRIPVTKHLAYRITVDAGDAHVASTTVSEADLSEPTVPAAPAQPAAAASTGEVVEVTPTAAAPVAAIDPSVLRQLVEQAVAKQVRPLREELDAAQEKIWTHDVLGGLGAIAGIFGVAYGVTARRAGRARPSAQTLAHSSAK